MTSNNADSFRNVTKYTGQNYRFTPTYSRKKDPTTSDLRDPGNQGYYPLNSFWVNTTNQNLWVLTGFSTAVVSGITRTTALWEMLSTGGAGPVTDLAGDDSVKVVPTALGVINLVGTVVANAVNAKAVFTKSTVANTEQVQIQVGAAIAATDVTKVGLVAFNNTEFTVDANGFVGLIGGGASIQKVNVQAGTTPIVPTAGAITVNGASVAAGTNPVQTNGTGPNTFAVQVQTSQAIAATDATKIGLAAFNSTQFTTDANGFVSLSGGAPVDSLTPDSGGAVSAVAGTITIHGTNGVNTTNGGAGQLNVNGITATTSQIGVTTLATNPQVTNGTYGTNQVVQAGNLTTAFANPATIGSTTANTGQFTKLAVGAAANPPALGSGNGINFNNAQSSSGLSAAVTSNNMPFYEVGTYTPTVDGATPGSTSYSTQFGNYIRVGNLVFCQGQISITGAMGTGDARFALPFTSTNTNQGTVGAFMIGSAAWTWPPGVSYFCSNVQGTTNYLVASGSGSGVGTPLKLQMTNNSASFFYTAIFWV